MDTSGNYEELGYLHVRELIAPEVARAFMAALKDDLGPAPLELSLAVRHDPVLTRPAFEFNGRAYKPMSFFLWAMTPTISRLIGRDLLPTYDYFRFYRRGDICKVHSDRPSCEHSVSLTLAYSDGQPWDLELEKARTPRASPMTEDFGLEPYSSVTMQVGDAVLYQGVHHRHGRTTPNSNAWSAHLFLHFVERGGPYADHAFDQRANLQPVEFSFV
ncbi:MAG: hypothetical protein JO335_08740 [Sphingomonas sp.]|nr:hypothetical protein [Sphingomonas sp.]